MGKSTLREARASVSPAAESFGLCATVRARLSAYCALCHFMQLMFMQLQRDKTEAFYLSLAQLCADLCVGKSAPISSLKLGGGGSNILLVLVCPPRPGTFQKSGMKM